MRLGILILGAVVQALLITYDGSQNLMEKTWFVMFHVSWCKHCKQVKPEFTSAGIKSQLKFITVDCEAFADVCKALEIKSYPTLRLYRKGKALEYQGGRMAEDLEEFGLKLSNSAVQSLDFEDWRKQIGKQIVSFTLMLSPSGKEQERSFQAVADRMTYDTVFFYKVPAPDTKVVVSGRDYREQFEIQGFEERELQDFVDLHRLPTMIELGVETFPLIKTSSKTKTLMVLAFDSHDLDAGYNLDPFLRIAKQYRRQGNKRIQFCFVDTSFSAEVLEPFQLQVIPSIIALDIRSEAPLFSILPSPTLVSADKFVIRVLKGEEELTPLELGYFYYAKKIVFAFLSSEFIYDNPVFFFLLMFSLAVLIGICAGELSKPKEE